MHNAFPVRSQDGTLWSPSQRAKQRRSRPSEGQLADCFAERHSGEVRFLAAGERIHRQPARKAGWIAWDGEEWLPDTLNVAQRLARDICREAAEICGDPAVDSNRFVFGVSGLAKCPRLVASDWPCHPDIEAAVDGWINDHCVLDPEAWTRRADLLASFICWERFDADDLTSAWAARGITYRRKANVHGFDGVKLREDGC